jgi:hypothetical protein
MAEPTREMVEEEGPGGDDVEVILNELSSAQNRMNSWLKRGEKVISLYRGEGDGINVASDRFNILWANVETQRPFIYSNTPKPIVRRRFLEPDPPARVAAEVMERALDYFMECDGHEYTPAMRRAVSDFLLPGRGQVWVVYDAEFEEYSEGIDDDGEEVMAERKAYEQVYIEHLYWKDFFHSDGRCWEDVWWVARGHDLTKHDLEEQFGKEVADDIPLVSDIARDDEHEYRDQYERRDCARVWEFWNKRTRKVYKVAEGHDKFLETPLEDPLELEQFFPCPKPLYMIETTGSLEPIPEYKMYERQAAEVNTLTDRITKLTSVLRAAAVYDANAKDAISKLVRGTENEMIPCENYASFMQAGGSNGAITWLPYDPLIGVIEGLSMQREKTMQMIYEVTGIVDILRGVAVPRETKGAAEARAGYATGRLGEKQRNVEKFARDTLAIMAEVIAEHFDAKTLMMITGVQSGLAEGQGMEQVAQLLRDDLMRGFRIDVETDSTIARDEDREKADLAEFLTGLSGFMGAATQAVSGGLMTPDVAKEIILFAARRFRVGQQLEEKLEQMGGQPPQPQEDPNAAANAMKMQIEQEKLKLERMKIEGEQALEAQKLQLEQAKLMQSGQIESQKIEQKHIEALINRDTARINASGGNEKAN